MTLKFKRAQKKYCYAPSFVAGLWNNHGGRKYLFKIISFESKWNQLLTHTKKRVDQLDIF